MIRAVLDTNVLVSGIVNLEQPETAPGKLLRRWLDEDAFSLIVSLPILEELNHAVTKPYFARRIAQARLELVKAAIGDLAIEVEAPFGVDGVATHSADDLVLGTAVAGDADFLVTGDRQLVALREIQNVRIVRPVEFLAMLDRTLNTATPNS